MKKRFACGHRGLGRHCHRCEQAEGIHVPTIAPEFRVAVERYDDAVRQHADAESRHWLLYNSATGTSEDIKRADFEQKRLKREVDALEKKLTPKIIENVARAIAAEKRRAALLAR